MSQKRIRWNEGEWQSFFLSMDLTDQSVSNLNRIKAAMKILPANRRRPVDNDSVMRGILQMYRTWKDAGGKLDFSQTYIKKPQKPSTSPRKKPGALIGSGHARGQRLEITQMVHGTPTEQETPKSLKEIISGHKLSVPGKSDSIQSLATKKLIEDLAKVQREIEANIEEARRIRNQAEEIRKKMPADLQEAMKIIQRNLEVQVGAMEVRMTSRLDAVYNGLAKLWLGPEESVPPLVMPVVVQQPSEHDRLIEEAGKTLSAALQRKPKILLFGVKPNQAQAAQRHLTSFEVLGTKDRAKATGQFSMVVIMKDFVRDDEAGVIEAAHPGKSMRVRGGITSVVNAVKNHFMIA